MARILVIEDNPDLRDMLAEVMAGIGHEVYLAADGEHALRWLKESTPDLVLTDIMMPNMDGLELLQALSLAKANPRIIAISGTPGHWMVLKTAQELGACRTLAKPFTRQDIVNAVEAVLAEDGPGR